MFSATKTINVTSVAPIAAITGAPASVPEGTPVWLGSLVTGDGPADTLAGFTYAWTVKKNGVVFTQGVGTGLTFTPDDNGTYVVTLTATDKDQVPSLAATATILATNVVPTAAITTQTASTIPQ